MLANVLAQRFVRPQLGPTNGTNVDVLRFDAVFFVLVAPFADGEHFGAALVAALHRPDAVVEVEVQLVGNLAREPFRTVGALDVLERTPRRSLLTLLPVGF